MKTNQEIFEQVVRHLRKQKQRCAIIQPRPDGGTYDQCMYRYGIMKCAAGALIDDAHYDPSLEGHKCDDYPVANALAASGVDMRDPTTQHLVYHLQQLHDHTFPGLWERAFADTATKWNLTLPPAE